MKIKNARRRLEKVVRNSLLLSFEEYKVTGRHFSEEALRYIVMNELSKEKDWGTFPNKLSNQNSLVFEYVYKKFKSKNGTSRPDISSIAWNSKHLLGNTHPLAVELKIGPNVVADIKKCRHYVAENKGQREFQFAVLIVAATKKSAATIDRRLTYYRPKDNLVGAKRILFGWIDLRYDEPEIELFWLK